MEVYAALFVGAFAAWFITFNVLKDQSSKLTKERDFARTSTNVYQPLWVKAMEREAAMHGEIAKLNRQANAASQAAASTLSAINVAPGVSGHCYSYSIGWDTGKIEHGGFGLFYGACQ